ncbi:RE1, partial [Symbiodinium sp. CCMP2456]
VDEEDIGLPVDDVDQADMDRLNAEYQELVKEVGDKMDYQVLRYAVPMRSRRASEVNARVRQMYLQVRADGLEVFRLHSDRAMELCNRRLREWLLDRGVLATTGEAQTPQQNGRAEATVKFVKAEARLLMTTAQLPKQTWPLAMRYATARQRHKALGRTDELPCFGTPVHVRTKIYGRAGKYDVDNKWAQGVYVGPSEDVQHGHVVRFPDGTFVTSLHLKQKLINADELVDLEPREVELPLPERRVRRKTRLARIQGEHPLTAEEEAAELKAKCLWKEGDWSMQAMLTLYEYLQTARGKHVSGRAASSPGSSWYTGMFVHGGVAGLRSSTTRLKWSTRYMVEVAKRLTGHRSFTALGVLQDMDNGCHKDSHNEVDSENVVMMLQAPDCGGELWLEHEDIDARYAEWKQVSRKLWKKGFSHKLEVGRAFKFNPRRWHEVQPWVGKRTVLVLYTPRINKLHYRDKDVMEFLGFESEYLIHNNAVQSNDHSDDHVIHHNAAQTNDHAIHNNAVQSDDHVIHHNAAQSDDHVIHNKGAQSNGAQRGDGERDAPELYLLKALEPPEDETLDDALLTLTENQNQLLEDLQERAERLRFMIEEEEILAEECRRAGQQTSEEVENVRAYLDDMMDEANRLRTVNHAKATDACLKAMITHEEPDYEKLLQNLEGDLEVVHTVPLDQVRAALDNWMEALEKEVNQLLEGTLKPMPLSRARELEKKGLLKLVPSKGVYTLKPPSVKGKKVRRKFRLVLCGNHVGRDDEAFNLYASGVSADTVRLALAFAAHRRWSGGTSDVTGAFLLAEWPDHLARYAIFPPKVLVEAGLARADEAWEVIRPLYGLRESPAIWAKCRTDRLREAKIAYQGRTIVLKQSVGDPELWLAFDEDEVMRAKGGLLALLITYVDDLLYLANKSLIAALHSWVQEAWPCSELEWADSKEGTRYLGMEIHQRPDYAFELSQEGYIRELLRAYDMEETLSTKLPCPREWLGEDSEEENYTVQELKQGQKAVGEQLWLMMRCRPDLQFPVGYLAAKVSKQPNRVVQIAKRLLAYLKATVSMKMVIGATRSETEIPNMAAWSDASFSPHGEKSYGASVVTINGSPIAWKASKQAFVTLSVMEAELLEASTATLLMENIGCLLDEICGSRVERKLFVDNASAVAMLVGGPGSWRTRHLKVRSARLREQVEAQELAVNHVNGTAQIADLATKMHPKMRLWELLSMWGFEGLPGDAVEALQSKATYLACLVLAMMCQPSEAKEVSAAPIQVAGMDELLFVTVLVCIATVAVWEAAKWAFQCVMKACKESPKQRKLRRLREAARAAAEEEVDRAVSHRSMETEEPSTPPTARRPTTPPRSSSSVQRSMEPMYPTGCAFEACPLDAFYKTDSNKSKLHTDPRCHGLRNAGTVYKVEYCAYCSKSEPLFVKRSRSVPRMNF